jgi:hypothetical protein
MASESLKSRIERTRSDLDEHVRAIVGYHFDPRTGCPFWLERAELLPFDPIKDIQCFDDLKRFGEFDDEAMRGGPVRRWVPKALANEPISVFETGGTTGVPKSRINVGDFRADYDEFSSRLPPDGFPMGANWLALGPTGPRRLRLAVEHLAQVRGGICFLVDMDPRWVVKLMKDRKLEMLQRYKDHVIDQGLTLLRAHPDIECMFTTPKLLEALCEKVSLKQVGIKGIFCGGTQMTAQFNRFAREELLEGAAFFPTYGNTLMGLACPKPFDPADDYSIIYYPPLPRAVLQVVDPDDADSVVGYGQTGRVKLTTLTRELFMPNLLERDEAVRHEPIEEYPWDGVGDVRPFSQMDTPVVEGVY